MARARSSPSSPTWALAVALACAACSARASLGTHRLSVAGDGGGFDASRDGGVDAEPDAAAFDAGADARDDVADDVEAGVPFGPAGGFGSVVLGGAHSCATTPGGAVHCWGANAHGQLGNGTTDPQPRLGLVPGLAGVEQLALGRDFTCARLSDGSVWCWGRNDAGQLGDGTTTTRLAPVRAGGPGSVFTSIAAGDAHVCAYGGVPNMLFCWGDNSAGQLGDGTTTNRRVPTAVPGPGGAGQLALGGRHTCAIGADRLVRCWGEGYGVTPVAITGLGPVQRIAAGRCHDCALVDGMDLRCWGCNDRGQLGDGTTTRRATPVRVTIPSSVASAEDIELGAEHSCALNYAHWMYCWGRNDAGQLGLGHTTDRSSPGGTVYEPPRGFNVVLSVGASHSCYLLLTDRSLHCWGDNASGQIDPRVAGAFTRPHLVWR